MWDAGEKWPDELNTEEAKSVIHNLTDCGVKDLIFSGCEATLRNDFFEIGSYAVAKGLNISSLWCSGASINEKVAKKLSDLGLETVMVEIDSPNPEKHDSMKKVTGSFNKVVNAIKALQKVGIKVVVLTTLTTLNIDDFWKIPNTLRTFEIENILFIPYAHSPVSRVMNHKELVLTPDQFLAANRKAVTEWKKLGKRWFRIFPDIKPKTQTEKRIHKLAGAACVAGVSSLAIAPNGLAAPCDFFTTLSQINHFCVGDLTKESIRKIWQNSPLLEKFRDRNHIKGKCGKCEKLDMCRGGCRAWAYGYYGDILASDPICREEVIYG